MRLLIALWGYGYFGHDVEAAVSEGWADTYEITAVFDRRFAELNKEPKRTLTVYDPARIREYYEKGFFDKVLITVFDDEERARIKSVLDDYGIPVLDVYAFNRFKAPGECTAGIIDGEYSRQGYSFYAFKDQILYFAPRAPYSIVYDLDLSVNGTFWRDFEIAQEVFPRFFRPPSREPDHVLKGTYCFLNYAYSRNYWHFTFELMDKVFLMERNGFRGKYIIPKTRFSEELLGMIGVTDERIVWTNELCASSSLWKVEKMIAPVLDCSDRRAASPVILEMAEGITGRLRDTSKAYPERVFAKRVDTRRLIISDSQLDKYGFKTIIPEELSVEEQIRYFMNARIVLSPHGANTTNAIYMKPGSVLIESFPASLLNPACMREIIDKGVHFLPVFQYKDMLSSSTGIYDDYTVIPEMLESTMIIAEMLTKDLA